MYSVYPTGTIVEFNEYTVGHDSKEASPCCREFSGRDPTSRFQEHSLFSIALSTLSFSVCVSIRIARAFPRPLEIL